MFFGVCKMHTPFSNGILFKLPVNYLGKSDAGHGKGQILTWFVDFKVCFYKTTNE